MPNVKPRPGWTNTRKVPAIDPGLLEKIEGATGVILTPEIRPDLLAALQKYLVGKDLLDDRPSVPEQRAGLEDLQKRAKDFADCLKNLDDASGEKLVHHIELLDQAYLSSKLVQGIVGKALGQDTFTDHRKRCSNNALYGLIRALIPIFERATGRKARRGSDVFGGPFVRFCQACLTSIHPDLQLHETTLHNLIRDIQTR